MKLAKDYPIRLVCRLLDVPRSSVYYAAQPGPDDEAMLKTVTDSAVTMRSTASTLFTSSHRASQRAERAGPTIGYAAHP